VLLMVLSPAGALFDVGFMGGPVNIGIPYAYNVGLGGGPGFSLITPFSQGSYIMNEMRTSTLANTYTGSLAIAFPQENVLDCSFPIISPTIAQTTDQSIVATQSYFWNDFVTGA